MTRSPPRERRPHEEKAKLYDDRTTASSEREKAHSLRKRGFHRGSFLCSYWWRAVPVPKKHHLLRGASYFALSGRNGLCIENAK